MPPLNFNSARESPWDADTLEKLGHPDAALQGCEPDFLIVSPPKTGTTWLGLNLSCHPDIFISEIKELHYFNLYWRQFDLNWYFRHFQEGVNLKKGEATPYAGLPLFVIRGIKRRLPRLKLIFLLRDPVERAWSHAKHDYLYRHGVFDAYDRAFEDIPEEKFVEQFSDLHSINIGDYLLCLKRWLGCFDRDQIYVDFYESIQRDPRGLLHRIFDHLNVKSDIDLSQFPMTDRINPGLQQKVPARLAAYLRAIYAEKTEEFVAFLREQFQLLPPPEWATTLTAGEARPLLLKEGYHGYNLFLYRSKFYAVLPHLNCTRAEDGDGCFVGHSLDEVKSRADGRTFEADREGYLESVFTIGCSKPQPQL